MKKLLLLLLLSANCYAHDKANCEQVERGLSSSVWRCVTPEGWLVERVGINQSGLTYVPDKEHKWKLDK